MHPPLDFSALPGDEARLLQVRTALPDVALLPERATMREAVSQPFELVLDCASPSAHFGLKQAIGEQMTVRLKQADGSYAPWHGYVLQAAQLGSDGGLARYRLTLGPWLAWLALRLDSFVFQDRTALQIVEEVFADYPAAQWRLQVGRDTLAAMRRRGICTQYRESDLAFVSRLLAQEGLHYWFEHLGEDAAAQADRDARSRHVLVIADAQAERTDLGPIRFAGQHRDARTQRPEDPIDGFAAECRLAANAVALGSWDCAKLAGASARAASARAPDAVPALEAYDGTGAGRYPDDAAADRAATLALAALELQARRFTGTGAARTLRAGACFSLVDHPRAGAGIARSGDDEDDAFTVLMVEHTVQNDRGSTAARPPGPDAPARGTYRNRFTCVRRAVPVVLAVPRAPTAPAALTACVVGARGADVHAERGHRVKVQMHFQRGTSPTPGGLPTGFGTDATGNAPGDERSGAWVRVAGPAAGAGWGAVYTPRVGAEVTLAFVDGDIDRPVVTGGLYRGTDTHPFAAGLDSGVNHAGVISGLHSRTLDAGSDDGDAPGHGGGFNQFALDDAPGQLRMRLHSSHAAAELGLGHLIQQTAHGAQRGAARGTGFEAGTAGWASVRAARGLLLSSTARAGTYASARGTQMEAGEGIARLADARELGQRLNQAARAVQARGLSSHDDGQAVSGLLRAVDPAHDGRHPDPAGAPAGTAPVPAFGQPVVMLDTPAALLAASDASITHYAGRSLGLATQGDLQQTAAHTLSQASGQTASLYAHQGGIRLTAAHGPVTLRAHTDALRILADRSVTVTSVDHDIRIGARQRIELVAGQSSITLDGGDIEIKTPGAFTVHGATHAFEGADSLPATLAALPEGTTAKASGNA